MQAAILFGIVVGVVMLALVFLRSSHKHDSPHPVSHQASPPGDPDEGTYHSESAGVEKATTCCSEAADRS
jgi:hypothetical protein